MINQNKFNYILLNEKYFYNIKINSDYRKLIDMYDCSIKCDKENNVLKFPNTHPFLENKQNFLDHILQKFQHSYCNLNELTMKMIQQEFKQQRKSK